MTPSYVKAAVTILERHLRDMRLQLAIARDSQLTAEELMAVLDVQPPEVSR